MTPTQQRLLISSGLAWLLGADRAVIADGAAVASRTEKFSAPAEVTALDLTTTSGDVHVVAGAAFAAVVELKVRAATQAEANEILADSKAQFSFDKGKVTLGITRARPDREGWRNMRVEGRFEVTLPAAAALNVKGVDASIKVEGIGQVALSTVNGNLSAGGMTRDARLSSVNGEVQGHFGPLAAGTKVAAQTVNGPLTLWFPPDLGLRLSAHTLNGEILSTLPFPPRTEGRSFPMFNRRYEGAVGNGDVNVKIHSVNGRIAVCGNGSAPDKARPIVTVTQDSGGPARREMLEHQAQEIQRRAEEVRRRVEEQQKKLEERLKGWDADNRAHLADAGDVRADRVKGDFTVERSVANVSVDSVTGRVKVKTRSGEVRIGTVAGSAEIDTKGGDIHLRTVGGGLSATTGAGDLRVDSVAGNAQLETKGGDIRVGACGGSVTAVTRGGDITARKVRGGVKASTAGGDIVVEVVGKPSSMGIELATKGGDVSLTLPRNFQADVTLEVKDADEEGRYIVSEFPEVTIVRDRRGHTATGKLHGGGTPVIVRARSGTVTLKKGPPG
jgi:DUF4097 and DUF4098 domain-containing protein YvlB